MDYEQEPQLSFELQIDDDSGFESPEVDRLFTGLDNPSGTVNTQGVDVRYIPSADYCDDNGKSLPNPILNTCGYINYSTYYYWRVRVQEHNTGLWSDWIYYNEDQGESGATDASPGIHYIYPSLHPDPWVNFGYAPSNPNVGQDVTFLSDSASNPSICYRVSGNNINAYFCDEQTSGWLWNFGDNQTSTAIGYTTHSYAYPNTYSVTLSITDDEGVTCQATHGVPVTAEGSGQLPNWREVSPFR